MFVWDDAKNALNRAKHGIGFDAVYDFDSAREFDRTRSEDGEKRSAFVGYGRLHAMIFTERAGTIRIISLRRANRKEKKAYEKNQNRALP